MGKNIALVTCPFMTDLHYCGPSLHCKKDKRESILANVFNAYKLFYYRIEPNNSNDLLAEPVFLTNESKLETSLSHAQIRLEKGAYNLATFLGNIGQLLTFTEFKDSMVFALILLLTKGGCYQSKIHASHRNSS